jgi:hypothetical protein
MKRIFPILAGAAAFIILTAEIDANNGRPISVGSPGEVTCNNTGCHNSFTINTGGGSIELTTTMNNWEYVPGTTYTFSFKVRRSGNSLFGMGMEALNTSNANAGLFVITQPAKTQLKSAVVGANNRTSVVHTLNGGAAVDSMIFQFNWNAPATNIGNVTLYFCGVAANGSNTPLSDYVYRSTQVLTPATASGLPALLAGSPVSVYPNPAREVLSVSYQLHGHQPVTARLFDRTGKLAATLLDGVSRVGECRENLSLPTGLPSGLYFLTLESGGQQVTQKVVLE